MTTDQPDHAPPGSLPPETAQPDPDRPDDQSRKPGPGATPPAAEQPAAPPPPTERPAPAPPVEPRAVSTPLVEPRPDAPPPAAPAPNAPPPVAPEPSSLPLAASSVTPPRAVPATERERPAVPPRPAAPSTAGAGSSTSTNVPAATPRRRAATLAEASSAGNPATDRLSPIPAHPVPKDSPVGPDSHSATEDQESIEPATSGPADPVPDSSSAESPAVPTPDADQPKTGDGVRRRGFWKRRRTKTAEAASVTPESTTDEAAAPAGGSGFGAVTDADPDARSSKDPQRTRRKKLPNTRPPGAPPDPWTAFATTAERPPGWIRRSIRATGRGLSREYALVTYISLILATAWTWPALRYPLHTVPQEVAAPARQAWQIAWSGHILKTDPAQLWHANAFFPERFSFAFGDSLLGYAPAAMLGDGPLAATLRYNVLFVLAHALLLIGGYALVRQLGAGRTGATVAAAAFAFAPWRLAQEGQLDIISAGGIPLALAMLARGHGWSLRYGPRPERRRAAWAAAGWLVAAWQLSLGFSLGLPFAYVLGGVVLVMLVAVPVRRLRRWKQGAVLGWWLLVIDVLGVVVVAGVGVLIALPYYKVGDTGPAATEIAFYSPPWRSLLIGPAESRIWGAAHAIPRASLTWPPEMTLLPGFVLYALALIGLVFSVWKWWHRLLLLAGLAAAVILTMGTTFYQGRWTYLPLFGHLPGSLGVRVPGRLMLWVTLLLAVLAGGAVAEFVRRAELMSAQRIPPWPGPWLRLATLFPLVLVLAESVNATPHPVVADQPAALRTVTAPMLILPTTAVTDQTDMLWSTSRFQPLANGGGGFAAVRQAELRRNVATFPDRASIDYLRGLGVTTVVLLRADADGTPWERAGDIPVDTLGIRREDLDTTTVLFRLN